MFNKTHLIVAATILVVAASIFGYIYISQRAYYEARLKETSAMTNDHAFHLQKERKANGELQAKVEAQTITIASLQTIHSDAIEQLRKEVGNLKNLVSSVSGSIQITDSLRTTLHDSTIYRYHDTIAARTFLFHDKWTNMTGLIYKDTAEIQYSTHSDFSVVTAWERQGLFKPKKLIVTFKSDNPHLDLQSLRPLVIVPPKKRWWETKAFAVGAGILIGGAAVIVR